ncbi:UBX domain-containing protein 6 [Cryptotermes secundus]|uniref:UBX domain-containing protein 6 n=1 Tax=Cryptotermes secundus TaxID=105785 RepID=A0A2J7QLG0_9NEOP|nr:UBX domain-containing protein 6 [Cryptotermes secundus]PNF29425.1 UBX domain-containing protein 6 [Cryptotermes secundus]PNF29426.1 UBX domain-containing protein 6 [Cryptotermes secundus]
MADKIKKFFQKKKVDARFKLAGPGHRLTGENTSQNRTDSRSSYTVAPRSAPSTESRQAAAAALARLDGQKQDHAGFNTSLAAIQAQVRRELEAEKKAAALAEKEASLADAQPGQQDESSSPYLAVTGVFFRCPMIGPDILTKEEWNMKIKEFLYDQLEEERGLTACLIIHTCNKNREKVAQCVDTLCKYIQNIIQNPAEEKFRKIRMSNRIYQDRVAPLEGTQDFLIAAGFKVMRIPFQDGEEDFWVFSEDNLDNNETLQILYDALQSAEPISLELDRNLQVLLPSQAAKRTDLPPVFFNITADELKREQQMRAEVIERSLMLRTKAMREKEEQREMRKYRYAVIRIRLPDGILLQGTFSVYEKLDAVNKFVRENLLSEELPFILTTPTGHRLSDEDADKNLADLRLAPATILVFSLDPSITEEVGRGQQTMYLKPEIMILVQPV